MRVFLAGSTGFIGGHILRALAERGHDVTCLLRSGSAASAEDTVARTVTGSWTRPETWVQSVDGHDAVVNAVGIIRERRGTSFADVHTRAPIALLDEASRRGVGKVVQISAMGADDNAISRFHLSKRSADNHLAQGDVPYVVLRPSFVYGPGDHSMSFFARLAKLPLTPVPGDGQYLLQPLHVDDLVRAVVTAVERDDIRDTMFDVGGSTTLTFDALLDRLALRTRRRRVRKVHIPWQLMIAVANATDLMGGRGPITRDELVMLRRGNHGDNSQFIEVFGFVPRAFE